MGLTELKEKIEELPEAFDEYYGYIRRDEVLSLLAEVTMEDVLKEYYSRFTITEEDIAAYKEEK